MRGLLVLVAACGSGSSPAAIDAPPAALPKWEKNLPDATVMGPWRGLQAARGIVHLHSVYSHDACDNAPRAADGTPNEPCLADLRAALCAERIDFADLTDHDASMADEDFPTLFSPRTGDDPVMNAAGEQIASRMTCADGHQVLITVGGENDLMPIMLHHHVPGTVQERHDIYNGVDAAAMQAFRDAGGLDWIAHTEQHDIEQLRTLEPDGIEVYNLHANIDPNIRAQYLGLDSAGAIDAVAAFADTNDLTFEPDLALMSFLLPSQPALTRWDQLLADGTRMTVTAGSDAHQNALPILLSDGERGDAYRRVLRWFGNIALVTDPHDPAKIEEALKLGRAFAVFELFGTPVGFDFHAEAGGIPYEMGNQPPLGATLTVTVPTVRGLDPSLPAPEITAKLIRVDASGPTTVVEGAGPTLTATADKAGAYRVEVAIVPHHLAPYLGDLGPQVAKTATIAQPWIYANPIYVR